MMRRAQQFRVPKIEGEVSVLDRQLDPQTILLFSPSLSLSLSLTHY